MVARRVAFNVPMALTVKGEILALPEGHWHLRWGGYNPTFGHLLSLVDADGILLPVVDDMAVPFEGRLRRIAPNKWSVGTSNGGEVLIVSLQDNGDSAPTLLVSAAPRD